MTGEPDIPNPRTVEPPATRNPPPLPYPGPGSRETYRPTPVTYMPDADGACKAYVTSCRF